MADGDLPARKGMTVRRKATGRAVTSRHVASIAGVSQSTVSRALSGDPRITEATRELVKRAAAEVGYVPDAVGRSLSSRATRNVGIVAADLSNPYYPHLLSAVSAELDAAGYRAVLFITREDERAVFEGLADGSIDGAILTTCTVDSRLPRELAARSLPFSLINRDVDAVEADRCLVDNYGGACLLAKELLKCGHRDFAFISGPPNTSTGRDRERGFSSILREAGVTVGESLRRSGPFSYETGHEHMLELLDSGERFTAVFCGNDVVALGAFNAAVSLGLRVPDDVSIVGFDDMPMASWDAFNLTTVRQDTREMGRTGVRLLLERIADPDLEPRNVRLIPRVVLRGTHSAPRPGASGRTARR